MSAAYEAVDAVQFLLSTGAATDLARAMGTAFAEGFAAESGKADKLADALEGALAWEAETRARLGLPQIDAPDWAQTARTALRAAGRLG